MKKILTLLLVGIFVLGILTGCQSNNETTQTNEQPQNTETSNQSEKTLVVYYSATGNTKAVAEMIAEETNGDLFEIEPKDSYSEDDLDWTDSTVVSQENMKMKMKDMWSLFHQQLITGKIMILFF